MAAKVIDAQQWRTSLIVAKYIYLLEEKRKLKAGYKVVGANSSSSFHFAQELRA